MVDPSSFHKDHSCAAPIGTSGSCLSSYPQLRALHSSGARDSALRLLQHGGVYAIDDDGVQLKLLGSACRRRMGIEADRVHVGVVGRGDALDRIVTATMSKLVQSIEAGRPFAVFTTDYHLADNFTGLHVVQGLDTAFKDGPFAEQWKMTGRVLLSAMCDEAEISLVSQSGLFDIFLRKPYRLEELENVLISSILLRGGWS